MSTSISSAPQFSPKEEIAHSVTHGFGAVLSLIGGAYTLGTVFFGWKRLPYHHAIWHLFVMAGSVLHFLAVYLYVIPRPR